MMLVSWIVLKGTIKKTCRTINSKLLDENSCPLNLDKLIFHLFSNCDLLRCKQEGKIYDAEDLGPGGGGGVTVPTAPSTWY